MGKLNLERQVYEELSKEYFKIEAQLKEKKGIDKFIDSYPKKLATEKQIEEVKQASQEQVKIYLFALYIDLFQAFHMKRVNDIIPQVKSTLS